VSLRAKKSRAIEGRKLTALFLSEKHCPVHKSEEGGLSARVGLDSECDEETPSPSRKKTNRDRDRGRRSVAH
jgi:hypothetical protein